MRRSAIVIGLLALVSFFAACGDSGDNAAGTTETASPDGSGTATTEAGEPAGALSGQYGVRYCEVLAITLGDTATKAEVWGTQGLNDCPQAQFAAIDPAAIRTELGVTAVLPNGPRFWVLDDIVANELAGSGEIRNIDGIEMRSIATVDLGPGLPDRSPYKSISVNRDTEFRFDAGRTIYELTAPDGSVYIMQSYTLEVDPTLNVASLDELGTELELPEGWTYTTRVLTEPLVVEDVDGVAAVVQDELHNSYQLRGRA